MHDIIVGKDVTKAEARLLELPGLKKYFNNLQTVREKDDFKRHMRKYISIWMPDCPFEVSTTNRYTITTHEAATTARRFIRSGDTIKYLCGNLVAMTPDEEKDMDLTRRDFSVVLSSRKKTPSLFLGPARFSNHDCNANARLVTRGVEGMVIVANQDIDIGNEITVNYGEHYFGKNNCECLCATCEGQERGGWSPHAEEEESSDETTLATTGETIAMPRPRRAKRALSESAASPLIAETNVYKKARLGEKQAIGLSTPPDSAQKSAAKIERKAAKLCTTEMMTFKHENMAVKGAYGSRATPNLKENDRKAQTIPPHSFYGTKRPLKQQSASELNAESLLPQSGQAQSLMEWMREAGLRSQQRTAQSMASIQSSAYKSSSSPSVASSIFDRSQRNLSSGGTTPSAADSIKRKQWAKQPTTFAAPRSPVSRSPSTSTLSSLPSNVDLDDKDFAVPCQKKPSQSGPVKRGRPRKAFHELSEGTKKKYMRQRASSTPRKAILLRHTIPTHSQPYLPPSKSLIVPSVELDDASSSSDNESTTSIQRTPGDYIRTRLLLSLNHSRWVDCRTCAATWVQANGYQTRKECPRCERHSYRWPKTENGKNETEERVMDHRTVHRFIAPDEEREERKRGRGIYKLETVEVVAEGESSSRAVSVPNVVGGGDEDDVDVASCVQRGGAGRRSMRGNRLAYV